MGQSPHFSLIMNIPTHPPMNMPYKIKELWIGLAEVPALKPTEILSDARGAFVNMITWASDAYEFRSKVELVLGEMSLFVVEIQNPEPIRNRGGKGSFDDSIEDMIGRAENNPNAILYGTFHTYKRDDA